ncbi:MAG: MauE/DoxX family redox-associated membrane protein [Microthrixaceae bacterium]
MEATTGIFQILAAVIAVGGAAKLVAPAAFTETLRALGLNGGEPAARTAGAVELAIGVGAIVIGGSAAALVVAAAYAIFAVTVVKARKVGAASCGCFGSVAAPPSTLHVVVNFVSALLALGAAATSPRAAARRAR